MRCQQGFQRYHFRLQPMFHLGCGLSDRVHKIPGVQDQREIGKMGPIGTANVLPALHLGFMVLHHVLRQLRLHTAGMGGLGCCQALAGLRQGLLGLPQTTENGQRIALGQIMTELNKSGMLRQSRPV